MLHVHDGNRLEPLCDGLIAALDRARVGGLDPLEATSIAVPSRAMERWVEMAIARRLGVAANLHFPRLERFAADWLGRVVPGIAVLDRGVYEARLLDALLDPGVVDEPVMAPVRRWLGDDDAVRDARAVELAARVAGLFEEYGFTRDRWLQAWRRGAPLPDDAGAPPADEAWQRHLFHHVVVAPGERAANAGDVEHVELPEALRRALARPRDAARATGPAPLHVFGFAHLSPTFHDLLRLVARAGDVHVWALNPCRELWDDVATPGERRAADRRPGLDGASPPDVRLLERWGRPGREHVARLVDATDGDLDHRFVEPAGEDLLHRLQRDVLDRVGRRAPAEAPGDASVQLWRCPSARREMEQVAAEIWKLVRAEPAAGAAPLRFHDVAVLIAGPEPVRRLAHLEAVFDAAHGLPFHVVDVPVGAQSAVVEASLRLLALPLSAFTRPEVLDVVAHPAVRPADVDPEHWVALVERLGVLRGRDARDLVGTYAERDVSTWGQAARRVALGWLAGDDAPLAGHGGPIFPVHAPRDHAADRLALRVRELAHDADVARQARWPLRRWGAWLAEYLGAYVAPRSTGEERAFRRVLEAAARLGDDDPADRPVSYRVAADRLRGGLEALSGARGPYLADGVAVSTVQTLAGIPFRAVFVVGLEEGRFPAADRRDALDLRGERRRGDVTLAERDRYAFLQTLLGARDRLVLSWGARDPKTGDRVAPSELVMTLVDVIEEGYLVGAGEALALDPPLARREDAEARAVFAAAAREHDARALGDALRARGLGRDGPLEPHEVLAALGDAGEAAARVAAALAIVPVPPPLDDGPGRDAVRRVWTSGLRAFLECPLQGWASLGLGLAQDDDDDAAYLEDEPFRVGALERAVTLRGAWLGAHAGGPPALEALDAEAARLEAEAKWPTGALRARAVAQAERVLVAWDAGCEALGIAVASPPRLRFGATRRRQPDAETVPGLRVAGPGERVFELLGGTQGRALGPGDTPASLVLVARKFGAPDVPRYALRAWLDHLMLAASGRQVGARMVAVLGGDPDAATPFRTARLAGVTPGDAAAWLADLAALALGGPHAYRLPFEAVADCWRRRRLDDGDALVDAALARDGDSCCKHGPVRDADRRPPPAADVAVDTVARGLGRFFAALEVDA